MIACRRKSYAPRIKSCWTLVEIRTVSLLMGIVLIARARGQEGFELEVERLPSRFRFLDKQRLLQYSLHCLLRPQLPAS
jgi:hypothetical protein